MTLVDTKTAPRPPARGAAQVLRQPGRSGFPMRARAALWCLPAAAVGWVGLALLAKSDLGLALCLGAPTQGWVAGFSSALDYQLFAAAPVWLAGEWALMVLAMMVPLALPHLAVFRNRLFRRDQDAATCAALAGFILIWMLMGIVAVPAMLGLHALAMLPGMGWAVPVSAYAIAIAWCFAGVRLRAFRRCHAVPVLHGTGKPVRRGAARYGMRLGGHCVGTCGFAMVAPMLAGQGLIAMALVTHVLLVERLAHRPAVGMTALPLALLGTAALIP